MVSALQAGRGMENKQPAAGMATSYVPEGQVLDEFLSEPQQAVPEQSVWIPALDAGTTLVVQTIHSRYHLEVLDPGRCTVILEGGSLPGASESPAPRCDRRRRADQDGVDRPRPSDRVVSSLYRE